MTEINIKHVTRIEGHANLVLRIKNKKIEKLEFQVDEGSRLFEAWLKGRKYNEVSRLASRICGICCASHTLGSLEALEDAFKLKPSEQTEKLRELMILGEFIQSHTLHLYCLALPDYLGFDSVFALADKYPKEVKNALKLKKLGNDLVELVAGRAVHQISADIAGFKRIPSKKDLEKLLKELKKLRPVALHTIELFENLSYPDFERATEYLALKKSQEYALCKGDITSSEGWTVEPRNWEEYCHEKIVSYSTAKQGIRNEHGYLVGPLARLNLNWKQLSERAKKIVKNAEIKIPSYNLFHANFARAVELLHCIDKSIELIENNTFKPEKIKYKHKSGEGYGATEAPRGTLYYHYKINPQGFIQKANILTPTAQNLKNLEEDISAFLPQLLNLTKEKIIHNLEMLVRAYDPCLSCATHFLKVKFV